MSDNGLLPGVNILVQRTPWSKNLEMLILYQRDSGNVDVAKHPEFQAYPQTFAPTPTMTLSFEKAQQLMDELWRCGVRPTDGIQSAGHLAALERHLDDMREIAMPLAKRAAQMLETILGGDDKPT